jgi:predicted phage-related endonuclease
MGLSAEQIALRRTGLGGSDANIIAKGDPEELNKLWQVKRGEIEPDDLSNILAVIMGTFSEPLNAEWFTKQTGREITHRNDHRISLEYPWMQLNLDGLTDDGKTYWEAKHLSAFTKEEEALERYLPQLTHAMIVLEIDQAVLSCFFGNGKWVAQDVKLDPIYAAQLIEREREFWECVKNNQLPAAIPIHAPIEPIKRVDFTGNNEWGNHAGIWLSNRGYAREFEASVKALKALVEPDVIEAFGSGIKISRSKAGALSIKEMK